MTIDSTAGEPGAPVTAIVRTPDPATRIGVDLSRIVKTLMALRSRAQVPLPHPGIDYAHLPILFALAGGPSRVSDLSGCVHSDISTVSRQVAALASLDLLQRVADPQDGRAQLISLTPAGAEAVERITTARAAWIRQLLADWSPAEAEDLARHLERLAASLTANLQRGPDAPDPHVAAHAPDSRHAPDAQDAPDAPRADIARPPANRHTN